MKELATIKNEYIKRETEKAVKAITENAETYARDYQAGYRDRMAHFYDKWYRYSRKDNGAAYDDGMVAARDAKKSSKWYEEDERDFHIIEIADCNR